MQRKPADEKFTPQEMKRKMAEIDRNSKHFNQEAIMSAAWGGSLDE